MNAPYCKLGRQKKDERYNSMGLITGYTKKFGADPLSLSDQLKSVWETYPPIDENDFTGYIYYNFLDFYPFVDSNIYKLRWRPGDDSPTNSFQVKYEWDLWQNFVDTNNAGFHWSKKPWWIYTNTCLLWQEKKIAYDPLLFDPSKIDTIIDNTITVSYFDDLGRPNTAEEIRVSKMLMILMGCRGLFYDGLSYGTYDNITRLANDKYLKAKPLDRDAPDSEYYNYLMNDSLGGDYIDFQTETTDTGSIMYNKYFFELYVNKLKPELKDAFCLQNLGVTPDKLYTGRKSSRVELYKLHRWIRGNDSILASSKLMAWHGKGYLRNHQQCPDSTGVDIMSRFLNVDSTKTRRLWVPDPNNFDDGGSTTTQYEPLSDQFYDLTLLKKDSIPMKQNYILGVSNRRVDPLVLDKYGDDTEWSIKFIPASEFDQLCFGPHAPHYRELFWKRHGAREISIKLDNPTDKLDSEVAFRVTELGKDSDLLKNEFWYKEPFNHIIDTNLLVGQYLKLRLLPGQAKLLNVEVLTPTALTEGDLDYSNQTKLVAFPCDSNYNANGTNDFGKVRYHMVYGRRSNQSPSYCNVYYKRSKPMNRFDKLDKDGDWEAELQLNAEVRVYDCDQTALTEYNLTSNYPSLVVRCETVAGVKTPMVYVVWQATGGDCNDTTRIRIIENVFPANTTNTTIPMAIQIADVHSDISVIGNGCHWGIPVINASWMGNFYAWNDYKLGIVAGFRFLGTRGWISENERTSFHGFPTFGQNSPNAYHPALNTYSTISDYEEDCALVWEENSTGGYNSEFNHIFYTRLKYCPGDGSGFIIHYVPQTWAHDNDWYHRAYYNYDSTIVQLDDPSQWFKYYHLPTIHRDVDFYDASIVPEYNGMWPCLTKSDRVYFQGRIGYDNDKQGIFMKFISIADSICNGSCFFNLPSNWLVEGTPMILSANHDLAHPNDAQGKLVKQYHISGGDSTLFYSYDHVANDSVAVLNFVEYPHTLNPTEEVPRTADIWQIHHSYFSLFYGPGVYDYSQQFPNYTPNALRIGSKGKYSHLARLPYINNDKTWEYGHRIYESSSDDQGLYPLIKSYDYLLFKKSYERDANYMFYGFEDTLGYRSVFTPIYMTIDGSERSFVPRFDEKHKIYSDTLYSDYFEIGNIQDIDMLHFGSNKKCLNLKLQRKDDKKLFSIQTDKSSERMDYTKHNIHLLNGKSKQYRFAWIKTTKSFFTEMTVLGLPPMNEMTKDEMLGKTSINVDENYLDLSSDITSEIPEGSSLFIYPNPANEKVVIFYEQEKSSNVNIAIYGMLGNTIRSVFSGDIEKGKYQYTVNTKDIPAGIYFVRAEGNNQTIVKKLIIE